MGSHNNFGFRLAVLVLAISGSCYPALSQQNDKYPPKQITSDEFPRSRDLIVDSPLTSSGSVFVFKKKPVYRLKRVTQPTSATAKTQTEKNSAAGKVPRHRSDDKSNEVWKQIGVTLWKLLETNPTPDNTESSRALVMDKSTGLVYGAERLAADKEFKAGDLVRLSIESPETGYLYVIDREIYEDGSLSLPVQIFPTMQTRGGNNYVERGVLTDIPSQSDRVPYFTLKSADSKWRGELITLIFSRVSLPELAPPAKASQIDARLLTALEDKYLKEVSLYEQENSESKPYTEAEKDAGAAGARQLTLDDPFPQTVYRVRSRPNDVILINLKLLVR